MVEPERDGKAEQAACNEENKQETAELLKRQRKELLGQLIAPSNMLGLLSLYLLFLGAVVAFGVFAFYTDHKITQEVVFVICIILFLALPVGAFWFLRPIFTKKDSIRKRMLERINQSSISQSLARIGNNRTVRIATLVLYALLIADEINLFPRHPRFSLTMIVAYVVISFALSISWALGALKLGMLVRIGKVLDLIDHVWGVAKYTQGIAEASRKYIDGTEKSHSEAHQTTVAAIRAINDALQLVAAPGKLAQVDASSQEPEGGKAEGGEEPTET